LSNDDEVVQLRREVALLSKERDEARAALAEHKATHARECPEATTTRALLVSMRADNVRLRDAVTAERAKSADLDARLRDRCADLTRVGLENCRNSYLLAQSDTKVARLRLVAVSFARANPKHHYGPGEEQDPCGVHALLAETADAAAERLAEGTPARPSGTRDRCACGSTTCAMGCCVHCKQPGRHCSCDATMSLPEPATLTAGDATVECDCRPTAKGKFVGVVHVGDPACFCGGMCVCHRRWQT